MPAAIVRGPVPVDVAGRVVAVPAVVGAAVVGAAVVGAAVVGAVGLRSVGLRSVGLTPVVLLAVVLPSGGVLSVIAGKVGGRIDCWVAGVDGPVVSVVGSRPGSVLAEIGGVDRGAVPGGIDCGAAVCETMMLAPTVRDGAAPVGPVSDEPLLIAEDPTGAVGVGPVGSASVLQATSSATNPTASASARTELRR